MDKQHIPEDLIKRYLNGTATEEEKSLVESWHIQDFLKSDAGPDEEEITQVYAHMRQAIERHAAPPRKLNPWYRYAAAACILLFLSIGGYFLLHKQPQQQLAKNNPEQIAPVNKGIVLTLNGGRQIQLNQKHQGLIAAIGNTNVNQSDSLLSYNGSAPKNAEAEMNTLANNSGKKFSLTLADGTEATLDVASNIIYPVNFTGKERTVTVTGQVLFKVKHNATQPFIVNVGTEKIQDIGTEFNVNAYANDPAAKTTLISGAVKVTAHSQSILLEPGEEAINKDGKLTVAEANLEEATAWLQGKIVFHHETLESIMRKVSRIYNVNVIWVDDMRNQTFGGSVSRSKKLSTVLNYFRKAGNVDFEVEGNNVKVFKKKH